MKENATVGAGNGAGHEAPATATGRSGNRNSMTSLILYGSQVKLTNSHKLVTGFNGQPDYYVRVSHFNGSHKEALDKARPMPGEVVLNTVPIAEPTMTAAQHNAFPGGRWSV